MRLNEAGLAVRLAVVSPFVLSTFKNVIILPPGNRTSISDALSLVFPAAGRMYVGHLESKERFRLQPAQLFNFS